MTSYALPPSQAELEWAAQSYEAVKAIRPEITSYGLGKPKRYENAWALGIDDRSKRMIVMAARWFDGQKPVRVTSDFPSYYAKHIAENWACDYIYEGAFIVAAIAMGFPFKRHREWSIFIGVSKKTAKLRQRNRTGVNIVEPQRLSFVVAS
jgi:hypothetical protein